MPCRYTRGFLSILARSDHYKRHGARLGIATEEGYETFADSFLRNPCPTSARQFVRPGNGDLVRYDESADVFATLRQDGFIRTCYCPDPRIHGEPTNLDYYLSQESKA
jgi:pyocin large subunit-like protein